MDRRGFDALFDLSGRTAVITGGSRGIGRAMAEGFACAGANVVIASRKADACAAAVADLTAQGFEALSVPSHVAVPADRQALVAAAVERFGTVDVLVNNAAAPLTEPIGAQHIAAWQKSFEVNLVGPALLTQECLPYLAANGAGSVINMVSVGAFLFARSVSIYAAMKAALLSLTRSSAAELVNLGIRVNAIAPGPVDTHMVRSTGAESIKSMAASTLMGRLAHPDELVGPALLLASDAGSFITGQVVLVDGGLHPH